MNPFLFLLFGLTKDIQTTYYSYNKEWFDSLVEEINDLQYQEHFSMTKSDFNEILELSFVEFNDITKYTFRRVLLLFLTYTEHSVVYRFIW